MLQNTINVSSEVLSRPIRCEIKTENIAEFMLFFAFTTSATADDVFDVFIHHPKEYVWKCKTNRAININTKRHTYATTLNETIYSLLFLIILRETQISLRTKFSKMSWMHSFTLLFSNN